MHMTMKFAGTMAWTLVLVWSMEVRAWHSEGHKTVTRLAVEAAGSDLPVFFAEGVDTVADASCDPDVFRAYNGAQLRDAERGEHYCDLELLGGDELPALRSEFVALCCRKGLSPGDVGMLPYTVAEWAQRLTVALAEHRRWPDRPGGRNKALVYAGLMSHYAADLCMPLHVTVHFDGRADASFRSPRSGIHARVDALFGKCPFDRAAVLESVEPRACVDVMARVLAEMRRSQSEVDAVYALEPLLPAMDEPMPDRAELTAWTRRKLARTAEFLASLYVSAWTLSGDVDLPVWLDF